MFCCIFVHDSKHVLFSDCATAKQTDSRHYPSVFVLHKTIRKQMRFLVRSRRSLFPALLHFNFDGILRNGQDRSLRPYCILHRHVYCKTATVQTHFAARHAGHSLQSRSITAQSPATRQRVFRASTRRWRGLWTADKRQICRFAAEYSGHTVCLRFYRW